MKILLKILLTLNVFFGNLNFHAQTLIVAKQDINYGSDKILQTIPLNNIRSIKFGNKTMIINMLKGSPSIYNIDEDEGGYWYNNFLNFSFNIPTPPNAKIDEFTINNSLTIYPNPTDKIVNINLTLEEKTYITIDIIDVFGTKIEAVFKGEQLGKQTYQCCSEIPKGIYFCRIQTKNNFITKPIIIY